MQIHRMAERAVAVLVLSGTSALAAAAERAPILKAQPVDKQNDFSVTILVSDEPGEAPLIDPKLVNAWGIAAGPQTTWRLDPRLVAAIRP